MIFWSHGPAAKSRWERLAMSGYAPSKNVPPLPLVMRRRAPFLFTRPIWAHLLCRLGPQSPQRTGLWPQGNSRVADLFLAAPLRRTFAQQLPRRCASGLLASQVRFVAEAGGSSQLNPSEPNSQKANGRKD